MRNAVSAEGVDIHIFYLWYNHTASPPGAGWLFSRHSIAGVKNHTIFNETPIDAAFDQAKYIMRHPNAAEGNHTAIFLDTNHTKDLKEHHYVVHFDYASRRVIVYGSSLTSESVHTRKMADGTCNLSSVWSTLARVLHKNGDHRDVDVCYVDWKEVRYTHWVFL